jgi:hypothetical protein
MDHHRFSPAICLEPGRLLTTVEEAAELLLTLPPHGPEWRLALKACADVIEGKKSASEIRSAFLAAAKAADRLTSA